MSVDEQVASTLRPLRDLFYRAAGLRPGAPRASTLRPLRDLFDDLVHLAAVVMLWAASTLRPLRDLFDRRVLADDGTLWLLLR